MGGEAMIRFTLVLSCLSSTGVSAADLREMNRVPAHRSTDIVQELIIEQSKRLRIMDHNIRMKHFVARLDGQHKFNVPTKVATPRQRRPVVEEHVDPSIDNWNNNGTMESQPAEVDCSTMQTNRNELTEKKERIAIDKKPTRTKRQVQTPVVSGTTKMDLWRQVIALSEFDEFDRYVDAVSIEKQRMMFLWLYEQYFNTTPVDETTIFAGGEHHNDGNDEIIDVQKRNPDIDDDDEQMMTDVEHYFDEIERGAGDEMRYRRQHNDEFTSRFADSPFHRRSNGLVDVGSERAGRFQDDDYKDVDEEREDDDDVVEIERRGLSFDDRQHRQLFDADEFGLVDRDVGSERRSVIDEQNKTNDRSLPGNQRKTQPVSHSAIAEALSSSSGGAKNSLVAAGSHQQLEQQQQDKSPSQAATQLVQFILLVAEQHLMSADEKTNRDVDRQYEVDDWLAQWQAQQHRRDSETGRQVDDRSGDSCDMCQLDSRQIDFQDVS